MSGLALRPTKLLDAASRRRQDDYDVIHEGETIGRIFKAIPGANAPQDRPWFWTILTTGPQADWQKGYAADLEVAKVRFRENWERGR